MVIHRVHRKIRAEFKLNATRAGIELGAPVGVEVEDYWLHRLFMDLLERKNKHLLGAREGKGGMNPRTGRTIPLNSDLLAAMVAYSKWYTKRFGTIRPEWYVFPFGKPWPKDPMRPVVTLKTSWRNVRKAAGVTGRWHDNRHTLITDLAESGAADETIRDIAGHVSKRMLKHYSHIRMEAKRDALESILNKGRRVGVAEVEVPSPHVPPAKRNRKRVRSELRRRTTRRNQA